MKKLLLWVALVGFATTSLLAQAQTLQSEKPLTEIKGKPVPPAAKLAPVNVTKTNRPVKKDGTPDKRFKANNHVKKDGSPDLRYKEHKAVEPAPAVK